MDFFPIDSFQKIILVLAIVLLIISLIIIGVNLSKQKPTKWPPVTPECPDWWEATNDNNQKMCVNKLKLGTCKPNMGKQYLTMDFNTPEYLGSNGLCAKYKWANNCGVSWDGVTYGIKNPCLN